MWRQQFGRNESVHKNEKGENKYSQKNCGVTFAEHIVVCFAVYLVFKFGPSNLEWQRWLSLWCQPERPVWSAFKFGKQVSRGACLLSCTTLQQGLKGGHDKPSESHQIIRQTFGKPGKVTCFFVLYVLFLDKTIGTLDHSGWHWILVSWHSASCEWLPIDL